MADREKVMYSLERCSSSVPDACRDCEYDKWPARICVQHLTKDALELLKAQEPIEPVIEKEYEADADGEERAYFMYYCGKCNQYIEKDQAYCDECGQAVKWDE